MLIENSIQPAATRMTGGAAVRMRTKRWRLYSLTARSIRSPAPRGAIESWVADQEDIEDSVQLFSRRFSQINADSDLRHPRLSAAKRRSIFELAVQHHIR